MVCYSPLKGWKSATLTPNGKRKIVFNIKQALVDLPVEVACGQCIGCRLKRTREWALRVMHESKLHKDNMFLTLTYNEDNVPDTLDYTHFQRFMKRYRKKFGKVRFYMCGEYGELLQRPHFHAIIFGHTFKDKQIFKGGKNPLYISESLSKLWPYGYSTIGNVTLDSAAYVSSYVMKKINGKLKDEHYKGLEPEFTHMSLKPGIAAKWFEKFVHDVFPSDECIFKGFKVKPPRYYDKLYDLTNKKEMDKIKLDRKKYFLSHPAPSGEQLLVLHKVAKKRLNQLKKGVLHE